MDLRAETIDRWASGRRCRQNHPHGCPHSEKHWHAAPRKGRADIQGLRAFAVIAVIIDHLTGWPGGGFVGVDVFFVISGFLITGLLLHKHERDNHISFVDFYRRRFKRIIPASVLVLVSTVIASYVVFANVRFQQIKTDAIWALLFGANWRYAGEKIDYFNADRAISPVQHYWSLSIEEQFYFVWPWLMLAIFTVLLRRNATRRHVHIVIGAVMGAIVISSFTWAVLRTQSDSHAAYFSTFTRIWELGVGAFLAVAATQLGRIPDAIRPVLAWAGLAGMVASLWVISGDNGFPAPAAALPVLATALVIAAGTYPDGRQQRFLWPLTNLGSGYVGDMSYSLYLWHFPIIVIGAEVVGSTSADKALLAVVIAVVSFYSYVLFEDPLRHATWFGPKRGFAPGTGSYQYLAVSALAVLAVALSAAALRPVDPPETALQALGGGDQVDLSSQEDPAQPQYGPKATALQAQIQTALSATEWPDNLNPTMDEAIASREAAPDVNACGGPKPTNRAACTFGPANAKHTAILVGDSVSITYAGALREALSSSPGWRLMVYGSYGCAFTELYIGNPDKSLQAACPDRKAAAVAAIKDVKPDVLFISNAYQPRVVAGQTAAVPESSWDASMTGMIDKLTPSVRKVVLLAAPPPSEESPADCYTKQSSPTDCASKVSAVWNARADTERSVAEHFGGVWIDPRPWFCFDDICPAFAGKTPVRIDDIHMTQAYAKKVGPALAEALVDGKVLAGD